MDLWEEQLTKRDMQININKSKFLRIGEESKNINVIVQGEKS